MIICQPVDGVVCHKLVDILAYAENRHTYMLNVIGRCMPFKNYVIIWIGCRCKILYPVILMPE